MSLIADQIEQQDRCVIAHHNLHSLYLFHREPKFREFYRDADWTQIDGMSIVALARFYGYSVRREQRVSYMEWMVPMMEVAARNGWRVFYLGSAPGIAETGAARLRQRYPALQIRTLHGYFDDSHRSEENTNVLKAILEFKPHLVMVGMGMPRQEYWIHENFASMCANVILSTGATMDYIAGVKYTPPRWACRIGLAWLFRLIAEPNRLWHRYLIEPWYLLGVIARDFIRSFRTPAP